MTTSRRGLPAGLIRSATSLQTRPLTSLLAVPRDVRIKRKSGVDRDRDLVRNHSYPGKHFGLLVPQTLYPRIVRELRLPSPLLLREAVTLRLSCQVLLLLPLRVPNPDILLELLSMIHELLIARDQLSIALQELFIRIRKGVHVGRSFVHFAMKSSLRRF